MKIKDSGERRHFETGAVRDVVEGKGAFDLLPLVALVKVSKVFEGGAKNIVEGIGKRGNPFPFISIVVCAILLNLL
ncbi:MAG: hypothetical protein HC836_24240 [Richelia sp. RM2_1_2]|nr:hypothetical protein [Richelia sp. RM2_1_2]